MINSLTPKQEQKLKEYSQTYLSYGLSTELANKELAEKTISEMYQKIGKDIPEFIWKPSPKSCIDFLIDFHLCNQLLEQLYKQLYNQLQCRLWNRLAKQLGNQLHGQLEYQLYDQLSYQLRYQLENQLRVQLWNRLGDKYTHTPYYGQFDLYWVAYYKYCFDELPVKGNKEDLESLNLFDQIGKSCSLWYPYENICVISDRPEEIHLNDFGELHNETGMAIKFRDDFGVYSIHGCQISKEIFDMYKSIPKLVLDSNRIRFKISINQKYISFVNNNNFLNKLNHPKPFKSIFNHLMKHYYL